MRSAIVIAFVGVYLMSYGVSLPQAFLFGDFITLICAFLYSIYIVLVGVLARNVPAAVLMFVVFFVTTLLSGVCAVGIGIEISGNAQMRDFLIMGLLTVTGTVLPYVLMGRGQRFIPAHQAALIYMLEPVFAMAIAVMFFGEQASILHYVGGSIILVAQVIAFYADGVEQPTSELSAV